jgi:hypothetical protein
MFVILDHLGVDLDLDAVMQSKLIQGRVKMGTVDQVIRGLIFDAEIRFQFRESNHTAVFPPPELNTFGLDDVSSQEWFQPPIQQQPARIGRNLDSSPNLLTWPMSANARMLNGDETAPHQVQAPPQEQSLHDHFGQVLRQLRGHRDQLRQR